MHLNKQHPNIFYCIYLKISQVAWCFDLSNFALMSISCHFLARQLFLLLFQNIGWIFNPIFWSHWSHIQLMAVLDLLFQEIFHLHLSECIFLIFYKCTILILNLPLKSGAIFKTLSFIRNLRMNQKAWVTSFSDLV